MQVVEREAVPLGAYRFPGAGRDGVLRRRGAALVGLLHVERHPVVLRAWPTRACVRLQAEAPTRDAAWLASTACASPSGSTTTSPSSTPASGAIR